MTKDDLAILKDSSSKAGVFYESSFREFSKEIWLISDDSEAIRESIRFFDHDQSGFFLRSLKAKEQLSILLSDGENALAKSKPCAVILDPSFANNHGYFVVEQIREKTKEHGILFIFLAESFSDLYFFSLFGLSADIFVTKPADDILLSYILEKSRISYQR